jgi:hypothetical protein
LVEPSLYGTVMKNIIVLLFAFAIAAPGLCPCAASEQQSVLTYWRAPGADSGRLIVVTEENIVRSLDAKTGRETWVTPFRALPSDAATSIRSA